MQLPGSVHGGHVGLNRTSSPLFLRGALLAAALTLATAAHAAPSAADRETARTLMDQGRDFRDKGDLTDALKRFQAANDIMHVPTTALEVARTQVALGLLVEARDTVAVLRQQPPVKNESPLFKTARAACEQLDASLAGRVPALTITLKGADASQEPELALDGVAVPVAVLGLPRTVNPGHHVVTAKTPTAEGKRELDIREGEQKPVEVTLVSTGVVAPSPVVAGTAPEQAEPPPRTSHLPSTLALVGIGVAGVGVITGAVTGILSLSSKSTLSGECANNVCGPSAYSTLSSATTLATVSDIAFGVAGAGAVVAIVGLVRGKGASANPSASPSGAAAFQVTPWFAGSAAGLRGSF